jgi:nucleoid-associated protein YgaU
VRGSDGLPHFSLGRRSRRAQRTRTTFGFRVPDIGVSSTDGRTPLEDRNIVRLAHAAPKLQRGLNMGLMDFVKDAGEKLFGRGKAQAAMTEVKAAPDDPAKVAAANAAAGDAIVDYIKSQNLSATGLTVTYDGATSTVSVFGVAPDQATKEKIALCCGNVAGVAKVNNMMSVDQSAPEATYYTVVSGDTLSKISKASYGDANKYMTIFEANKPMLSDPNKIYPGQVLRIPPL